MPLINRKSMNSQKFQFFNRKCSPRRWSGAGGGDGMLRGAGDSLIWKYKSYHIFISFFDRYDIHIKYFVDSSYGDLRHGPSSFFDCSTFQKTTSWKLRSFTFSNVQWSNVRSCNASLFYFQITKGSNFQVSMFHNSFAKC